MCLELWSTAEDSVRIAAFISIRKLASAPDHSVFDMILKVCPIYICVNSRLTVEQSMYSQLVRSSKTTSAHTLPSINLMKNTASEIFCINHASTYQQAFGYIRQLAIHLRSSMKTKTKVGSTFVREDENEVADCSYRSRSNRYIIGNSFIASIFGVWCLLVRVMLIPSWSEAERKANCNHLYFHSPKLQ